MDEHLSETDIHKLEFCLIFNVINLEECNCLCCIKNDFGKMLSSGEGGCEKKVIVQLDAKKFGFSDRKTFKLCINFEDNQTLGTSKTKSIRGLLEREG